MLVSLVGQDDKTVYINPDHVMVVQSYQPGEVVLRLQAVLIGQMNFVTVKGDLEAVAVALGAEPE